MATKPTVYRKTNDGQWVVYGETMKVKAGQDVTVTKRDGSTKVERVTRTGKAFVADGRYMVYGYLQAAAQTRPQRTRTARSTCPTDGNCSSFGNGRSCGSPDCDGW